MARRCQAPPGGNHFFVVMIHRMVDADDERPDRKRTDDAPVADVRKLDLSPCKFRTAFVGLFLFIPLLCEIDLQGVVVSTKEMGLKVSQIARRLGVCRNTVYAYLDATP